MSILRLHSACGTDNHLIDFVDDFGPLIDQNINLRPYCETDAQLLFDFLYDNAPAYTILKLHEKLAEYYRKEEENATNNQ